MKKWSFCFIAIALMFQSCGREVNIELVELAANEVVQKTAQDVAKKHSSLTLAGFGGSYVDGIIKSEKMVFNHRGVLAEEAGRALIQEIVTLYFQHFSEDKRLSDQIMNLEALQVVLLITDRAHNELLYPNISVMRLKEGKISFQAYRKTDDGVYHLQVKRVVPLE